MNKIFKLKHKKTTKKKEQQIRHKGHNGNKWCNICKTGAAERDERENGTETLYDMILRILKNRYTTSAHRLKIQWIEQQTE